MKISKILYIFFLIVLVFFTSCTRQPKLYRLSNLYNIRQLINPKGTTYFSSPLELNYIKRYKDTKEFVFVADQTHLAVYIKKNQYWRIYTYSDGYMPVRYNFKHYVNYENYFAVKANKTTVNIFDKKQLKVYSINSKEYEQLKKIWKKDEYESENIKWFTSGYSLPRSVVGENVRTGRKKVFYNYSVKLNDISGIFSGGDNLIAKIPIGLRVLSYNKGSKFINSTNELLKDSVITVKCKDDKLLVLYEDAVDIFNNNVDFKLILRRSLQNKKITCIDFNDTYIFYSIKDTFVIENINSEKVEYIENLSSGIEEIKLYKSLAILKTKSNFATFDVHNKKLKYFIDDQTLEGSNVENIFSSKSHRDDINFTWIGFIDNYLIGLRKKNSGFCCISKVDKEIIAFDLENNKIIKDFSKIISSKLQTLITKSSYINLMPNYVLSKDTEACKIYKLKNNKLIKKQEFYLNYKLTDKFIPDAFQNEINYPIGNNIKSSVLVKKVMWIATDKGLFSYDLRKKVWKSYFIGPAMLYGSGVFRSYYIRDLLVTDESIYSQAYISSTGGYPWAKIDRKTFKLDYFSGPSGAAVWSFKIKKNKLIHATANGIRYYDFNNKKTKIFKTSERLNQVAFYNKKYLGANTKKIYLINRKGVLEKQFDFKHKLTNDEYNVMETDNDKIWFGTRGQLTIFDLKKQKQIDYILKDIPYGEIIKVFPGRKFVWIISAKYIYLYDKIYNSLFCLGKIRNQESRQYEYATITDAVEEDNFIYITSEAGIFKLNKKTLMIEKSNITTFMNGFSPTKIEKHRRYYFIGLGYGILQIKDKELDNTFTENDFILCSQLSNNIRPVINSKEDSEIKLSVEEYIQKENIPLKTNTPIYSYLSNIEKQKAQLKEKIKNVIYYLAPTKTNCYIEGAQINKKKYFGALKLNPSKYNVLLSHPRLGEKGFQFHVKPDKKNFLFGSFYCSNTEVKIISDMPSFEPDIISMDKNTFFTVWTSLKNKTYNIYNSISYNSGIDWDLPVELPINSTKKDMCAKLYLEKREGENIVWIAWWSDRDTDNTGLWLSNSHDLISWKKPVFITKTTYLQFSYYLDEESKIKLWFMDNNDTNLYKTTSLDGKKWSIPQKQKFIKNNNILNYRFGDFSIAYNEGYKVYGGFQVAGNQIEIFTFDDNNNNWVYNSSVSNDTKYPVRTADIFFDKNYSLMASWKSVGPLMLAKKSGNKWSLGTIIVPFNFDSPGSAECIPYEKNEYIIVWASFRGKGIRSYKVKIDKFYHSTEKKYYD